MRSAHWILSALLGVWLGSATARADIPLELRNRPVVAVEIAGETAGYTQPREIGIPLGAPLTRSLLRTATERLAESGRWADVQMSVAAEGDGARVIVTLVPRMVVARIQIEGNRVIEDLDLRRSLGVEPSAEIPCPSCTKRGDDSMQRGGGPYLGHCTCRECTRNAVLHEQADEPPIGDACHDVLGDPRAPLRSEHVVCCR